MLPFISFWQWCATCWTTPTNITLINSFVTEMLWHIKTIWTESPYVWKHVPPSWFDSGKFTPPRQTFMSKSLRRARQTLWSTLAIRRIHIQWDDLANIWDSFAVIAKNKTIIRDRQKLTKIEQNINKKKYELSVWWWRTDKIWWITLDNMKETIKRYQNLNILDSSTTISEWSEYWDLVLLLWKTTSSLKHLVALWWEERALKEKGVSFKNEAIWRTSIKIKNTAVEQIKSDYICTRRYACEESWWNIKDELKKIKDAFWNWLGNARSEVKRASNELAKAYSKENLKKVVTEQAIFWQLSWALQDLKDFRKRTINEIKTSAVYQQFEDFSSDPNPQQTDWEQWPTTTPKTDEEIRKEDISAIAETISSTTEKSKDFEIKITNNIALLQQESTNMKNKYKTLDTPVDILMHFVVLSEKINSITNNLIGSKDSESDCLIKNLGALCEKQCNNIYKKCYY